MRVDDMETSMLWSYVALRVPTSRIDPPEIGCQPCRNER
jgi:hypothetical protein